LKDDAKMLGSLEPSILINIKAVSHQMADFFKLRFNGGLSKTPHPSATPPPSPRGEGLRKANSEAIL
jgi:hypothetical protein